MPTRFQGAAVPILLVLMLGGCTSPTPEPTALPTPISEGSPTAAITAAPTETEQPPTATDAPTDAPTLTATAEPLDVDPALAAWLQQSAIPFETTEAGSGFADLQALKPIIGDARIVGLGEATHGTHEFFQMKHRLLEFMVEEMGFTTFAIEDNFVEAEAIDAYVQGGAGNATTLVRSLYWVWMNDEMIDLIEWMRAYNADKAPDQRIHFRGFDMQNPVSARSAVIGYVQRVDSAAEPLITEQLSCVDTLGFGSYPTLPDADRAACRADLQAVYDHLARSEAEYAAQSSLQEFANALHTARTMLQSEAAIAQPNMLQGVGIRDQAMAENIAWLLEQAGSETRMVLWAHNGHVAAQPGSQMMGDHLRQRFGDDYLVMGFSFNQGRALALDMDAGFALYDFALVPAPAGSIDYAMRAAQLPRFMLDLRAAPPEISEWLNTFQPMRNFGYGYTDTCPQVAYGAVALAQSFDVVIYFEDTTPAAFLSDVRKQPAPESTEFNLQPTNLDFELSTRCWFTELGVGGTSLKPDRAEAHSGSASARFSVRDDDPDRMVTLTQNVIPLAYAGQRVRITGYVRTGDLDGSVGLKAAAYGLGVFNVLGEWQTPADQALRADADWTQLELIADIPQDALMLSFGLYVIGSGDVWLDDVTVEVIP